MEFCGARNKKFQKTGVWGWSPQEKFRVFGFQKAISFLDFFVIFKKWLNNKPPLLRSFEIDTWGVVIKQDIVAFSPLVIWFS